MEAVRDAAIRSDLEFSYSIVPVTAESDSTDLDAPHSAFMGALRVALLSGECDILVHPFFEMSVNPHPDLRIGAVTARRDPRDVVLTSGPTFSDLPSGARIAVKGGRRAAQILALRPDLTPVEAIGGITSRVERLHGGEVEALVVPRAHLEALGLAHATLHVFDLEEMMPGPGDGVLGIEVRADAPDALVRLLDRLDDAEVRAAATAECAAFDALGGSAEAPIGTYATVERGLLHLHVRVLNASGTLSLNDFSRGPLREADLLGRRAALALVGRGARLLLSASPLSVEDAPHR
jgi:hydroxymethylbilane synthase